MSSWADSGTSVTPAPLATATDGHEPAPVVRLTADPDLRQRRNNFDLLRLLAATQVIYLHAVLFLDIEGRGFLAVLHYLAAIFPGVPIFFVMSGFLVSQSYERNPDVRRYFGKRALRIFPALWFCLAVTLLLLAGLALMQRLTAADFGASGKTILDGWSFPLWVVGHLTFGQFLDAPAVQFFGVGEPNPSLWTIPVEMAFYVLVPALYWLVVSRFRLSVSTAVLGGIALLSFVIWYVGSFTWLGTGAGADELQANLLGGDDPRAVQILRQTPLPYLYWFIMGVLLWRHIGAVGRLVRDRVLLWTIGYVGLAGMPVLVGAEWVRATLWYQLARAVTLALWALSFALSFRGASHRVLRGQDLSFGLYLFHMLVINAFIELGLVRHTALLPVVFLVSALLATISWKLVEKPAIKKKTRLDRPSSSPSLLASCGA